MSLDYLLPVLWAHWPWWLAGALAGLWLTPLARTIPRTVLQRAGASRDEWLGPGGGIDGTPPRFRHIWVALLNAGLWGLAASATTHPDFVATLCWAGFSSTLLLLALIDWDATLLPDMVVWPLALAGLLASRAGFTGQNLAASALSAAAVLALFGGVAWAFRRIRGASGIGGGDLKLLAALGAWLGVAGVGYVMFLASLLTVAWNLAWRHFKGFSPEAEWPFGPSIVIAALAWSVLRPV